MKKKKWLIDAHNLMHQIPQIKAMLGGNHLEAMRQLCRLVSKACKKDKCRAMLVFDGVPLLIPGDYAGLKLRFSRERTADEVIISMLSESGASADWILVSDDREIRQKAFYYYVDIIRCPLFIDRILDPQEDKAQAKPAPTAKAKKPLPKTKDPGEVENPPAADAEIEMFLKLFKKEK